MSFTGKTPASTFKDIMYVNNNNNGITTTTKTLKSGNGNDSCMAISDRSVAVTSNTDNSVAFGVKNAAGSSTFNVDTTNNEVKALGTHTNTQYANFICHSALTASFAAGYHNAIPFENAYALVIPNFPLKF